MSSRPTTAWPIDGSAGAAPNTTEQDQFDRSSRQRTPGLDRPLPPLPPSSSLPKSYEIPTLRQRLAPESPSKTSPSKHNRSVSHPFPSFFGGKKLDKRANGRYDDDFDSSDSGSPARVDVQRTKTGPAQHAAASAKIDRQPVTGKCMTCDSTVRWPQGVRVFRCTTCLTINDLDPYDENRVLDGGERLAVHRKAMPISIERTKALLDHCLNEYLVQQLYVSVDNMNSVSDRVDMSKPSGDDDPAAYEIVQLWNQSIASVPSEIQHKNEPSNLSNRQTRTAQRSGDKLETAVTQRPSASSPTRHPRNLTAQRQRSNERLRDDAGAGVMQRDPSLAIFRTVESYISGCCAGCATLNMSFFTVKPPNTTERTENHNRQLRKEPVVSAGSPLFEPDSFISEMDAKTLLLGDVVENGSWWTGRPSRNGSQNERGGKGRDRSPDKWTGIVSVKSPRINWAELAEWYRLIMHAGDDWQRRWTALRPEQDHPAQTRWESVPLQRLQYHVAESQLHLQRALLKAVENLLKRPRRPLGNPEDCRFLFMLLACPLLHADLQRSQNSQTAATRQHTREASNPRSNVRSSPAKRQPSLPLRSGSLGQHSGIVKRILGLISNLPNEIHQFCVSWMSRFSDAHFQRLVDMVSSFVAYRLSRQQDRGLTTPVNPTDGLVPSFSDSGIRHASQLHAALELRPSGSSNKKTDGKPKLGIYSEDWQIKAAARVMALLFQANTGHSARRRDITISREQRLQNAGLNARYQAYSHGQMVPISNFYNTVLDHLDLIGDFEAWETTKTKFTFCQYPFFLSIWAKIRILEYDARRQMEVRAREAFFDSILSRKAVSQYLVLKVRRDCLVEDSLKGVSETVGSGSDDIKKGLRIDFVGEEGIDAGGLRKEWFLLLVREIFDPHHGLFIHDEDSQYCYFNPFCFESSEQFFLVGVLLGLAIYNSTILDIAFPPFVFKKMLASAPPTNDKLMSAPRVSHKYTLEDLAELRPSLARGLRQMLEFEGNVEETFCRDFVAEMDRYGELVQVPLCQNGHKRAVTNSNRREFVDLYVRYLLDGAVARQYEPFKRGFFTVCGGNALSLFRPEEIELLVRGSDEPLDINSLRAVATYDNWPKIAGPAEQQPQVIWFWDTFQRATPTDQRKMLGFITGSDRIPAMGATNLIVRVQLIQDKETEEAGIEIKRFPTARTCFNTLSLYRYRSKETLEAKLWMAVKESEGFGLK